MIRIQVVFPGNCTTGIQSAVQHKTLGKIQVLGTDDWKEVMHMNTLAASEGEDFSFQNLLAVLPADILLAEWGGTRSKEGICMGGEVTSQEKREHKPTEITGEKDCEGADDIYPVVGMGDIHTVKIAPGSEITFRYTISQDCHVRWKFKSEGGDLTFGVKKKKALMDKDNGELMEDSAIGAVEVINSKRVVRHIFA